MSASGAAGPGVSLTPGVPRRASRAELVLLGWLASLAALTLVGLLVWRVGDDPAALATLVLAIGALAGVVIQLHRQGKRDHDARRRAELAPLYEEVFNALRGLFQNGGSSEERVALYNQFTNKLIFWGSEDAVRAWSTFRLYLIESRGPLDLPGKVMRIWAWGDLLVALRRDLGHKDDLSRDDLLRLFIKDYDEVIRLHRLGIPPGSAGEEL